MFTACLHVYIDNVSYSYDPPPRKLTLLKVGW